MFVFLRYKPVIMVGAAVLAVFFVLDITMRTAFGPMPVWGPDTSDGAFGITEVGVKVAGITRARHNNALARPLNLVIGLSASETDVDCSLMETLEGDGSQWLNVRGHGSSFVKLRSQMTPLWLSGLHPNLVVILADPAFIAGNPSVRLLADGQKSVRVGAWEKDEKPSPIWFAANQVEANSRIQHKFLEERMKILTSSGQSIDAAFEPLSDIYQDMFPYVGKADADHMRRLHDAMSGFGVFSSDSYKADGLQANAFLDFLRECRKTCGALVVVIQPAPSAIKSEMPANALTCMYAILEKARLDGPLTIFNMRDAQPDELFYDSYHMNMDGRQKNTQDLARRLKESFGQNVPSAPSTHNAVHRK